jgi:hypothetical protein
VLTRPESRRVPPRRTRPDTAVSLWDADSRPCDSGCSACKKERRKGHGRGSCATPFLHFRGVNSVLKQLRTDPHAGANYSIASAQ